MFGDSFVISDTLSESFLFFVFLILPLWVIADCTKNQQPPSAALLRSIDRHNMSVHEYNSQCVGRFGKDTVVNDDKGVPMKFPALAEIDRIVVSEKH